MLVKIASIVFIFAFVKTENDIPLYALCNTLPTLLGNLSLWLYLPKYYTKSCMRLTKIFRHILPMLTLFIPQVAIEIYTVLDKTMLGKLGSDLAEVGYYEQSQKIVKVVLSLVTALGVVMLPKVASAFSEGQEKRVQILIKDALTFVFVISFPMAFGLIGITNNFVPWFFGEGFQKVTILLRLISPIIIAIGISNVIGMQYLLPTNQDTAYTISVLCGAGINFLLNLVLIPKLDSVGASVSTVIAELGVTCVQIYFVRKQLPILQMLKRGIKYFAFSLLMGICIYYLGSFLEPNIGTTILQIFVGFILYFLALVLSKDPFLKKFLSTMIKIKSK